MPKRVDFIASSPEFFVGSSGGYITGDSAIEGLRGWNSEPFTDLTSTPGLASGNNLWGFTDGSMTAEINVTAYNDDVDPNGDPISGGTLAFSQTSLEKNFAYRFNVVDDNCTTKSPDPVQYSTGIADLAWTDTVATAGPIQLGRDWRNRSLSSDHPYANLAGDMSLTGLPWLTFFDGIIANTYEFVGINWTSKEAWAAVELPEVASNGSLPASGRFELSNGAPDGSFSYVKVDGAITKYVWSGADGRQAIFDASGQCIYLRLPSSSSAAGGSGGGGEATITYDSGDIDKIEWTPDSGSPSVKEEIQFSYASGKISTLEQTRGGTVVRSVAYDYGSDGKIKYVRKYNGLTNTPLVDREYYRWYTDTDSGRGYDGGLKLWLDNASYELAAKKLATLSYTVENAPDADDGSAESLVNFANNYFEYAQTTAIDNSYRVTKEKAQGAGHGCSACGTAGQGKYSFSYAKNATTPTSNRNAWSYKTTESVIGKTSGGSDFTRYQNIVYTNEWAQPILIIRKDTQASGSPEYYSWYKYDDRGQVILTADNSAVTGFDESYPDLVHPASSGTTYLSASAGRLDYTKYFTSADSGVSAQLHTYVKERGVKNGESGSEIKTDSYTYTDGGVAGDGVWYPETVTEYPDATDFNTKNVTTYQYVSWHQASSADTAQVLKRVTKLPQVSSSENGKDTTSGGSSNDYIIEEYFDRFGHVVWRKDAEGYVDYFEYDALTGAQTREIRDADPSNTTLIPSPAVTAPSRGSGLPTALNLETSTRVDGLGRPTRITDPKGNKTYIVYDDTLNDDNDSVIGDSGDDPKEIRTYTGWNNSTKQPTGPVHVQIEGPVQTGSDAAAWVIDNLTFTWSESTGLPNTEPTTGVFEPTGAESLTSSYASIQSLSRQRLNQSKQVTEQDTYYSIPTPTSGYFTSGGLSAAFGTEGTNYNAERSGYNTQGLLFKRRTGNGTYNMMIYDGRGNMTSQWVGTNVTSSTEFDPTGGGASGNNMKEVTTLEYGDGDASDGLLTETTVHPDPSDSSKDRVTLNAYDWRHRLVATKSGVQGSENHTDNSHPITFYDLDNLGRVTTQRQYDGDTLSIGSSAPSHDALRAKTTMQYDAQGRVYRTSTFGVNYTLNSSTSAPSSATEMSALVTNNWYDLRGNLIKTSQPGGIVSKNSFDAAGRITTSYQSDGGGDSSWSDADDVSGDKVIQQTEYTYDANGNVILSAVRQRMHDATGTGELGLASNPFTDTATQGSWHDNYGSEGYSIMQDSASLPAWMSVSTSGKSDYVWSSSSSEARATENAAATGRLAACWYSGTSFDVDISITDGKSHEIALYALDWDSTSRAQTVQMIDPSTSAVLATQSMSNFHDGKWAVFQASGNVKFRFTQTAGYNAVLSAIAVDPARTPARTSYTANYYDAANRVTESVNVGTNAGQRYIRPSSAASRSDNRLVTSYEYATDELQTLKFTGSPTGGTFTLTFGSETTGAITYSTTAATLAANVQTALASLSNIGSGNVVATSNTSGIVVVKFTGTLTMRDVAQLTATPSLTGGTSPNITITTSISGQSGSLSRTTDPRGLVTLNDVDRAGRTVRTVEGYSDGDASNSDDRITEYTFDGSNHVLTLKAVLPAGVFQQTQYVYAATTSGGSNVNSNEILTAIQYPDKSSGSASSSEQESYKVNALGEMISKTDRNVNVHAYSYDVLGRLRDDNVTTLGSGVDGTVRLLRYSYNTQGLLEDAASYGTTAAGSLRNDVMREYNGLGQITAEYQEHSGSAVNTSTSPKVQYDYSEMDSGANHSRLTQMHYPNGRIVRYEYNSGLDNNISRISFLADDDSGDVGTPLEEYTYLGAGTVVKRNRPEPGTSLSYIGASNTASDSGDWYSGFDRFGRVIDQKWNDGTNDIDRFKYGYDQDSNVLYKNNTLTDSLSGSNDQDELYHANGASAGYDSLNRLTAFRRGKLSDANSDGVPDTVSSTSRYQTWTLDALGNWTTLNTSGTNSNKTHNKQNQLTNNGTSAVTYDSNGSMNVIGSGGTAIDYDYDAWNRLVKQTTGSTTVATHTYDALGRRVSETPANSAAKRDLYYSTRWQVLEERDSNDLMRAQMVFSPFYVDEMIERDSSPAGALDTSFDGDGKVLSSFLPSDSESQSEGHRVRMQTISGTERIIVAGKVNTGAADYAAIARYNLDGSLDTSFGTSGIAKLSDGATYFDSLAVQSDGKIVAVGRNGAFNFFVCRFTAAGALDTSFDSDGKVGIAITGAADTEYAHDVAIDSNGKIIVAGTADTSVGVARLNSDGSLDTGFDSDGKLTFTYGGSSSSAAAVAVQSDDRIVIAGGTGGDVGMARLNTDGSFDTNFDSDGKLVSSLGGSEAASALAIDSSGNFVITGGKDTNLFAARYTSTGSLDTTFNSTGSATLDLGSSDESANGLQIQSDGKIILGGYSNADFAVVRLNTDGSKDSYFGAAGVVITDFGRAGTNPNTASDYIQGITLQSDGKLVAAGYRQQPNAQGSVTFARYLTGTSPTVRHYVQQDANYNVTSITSDAGVALERYNYDPYGTPTIMNGSFSRAITASAYGWQYLHQGGRYDSGTGLYHFRNRELRAADGRWLQADPLGYVDGMNRYEFVRSNPVKYVDPLGRKSLTPKMNEAFRLQWLGILTLTISNYVVDDYTFFDEDEEMFPGDLSGSMKTFYAKFLKDKPLTRCWKQFTIPPTNAAADAPWIVSGKMFTYGYWLGSTSTVMASGYISARIGEGNFIEIRNLLVDWAWIDDVDAKSFAEMWSDPKQGWGNFLLEGTWDFFGDKVIDSDYDVTVKGLDNRKGPIRLVNAS